MIVRIMKEVLSKQYKVISTREYLRKKVALKRHQASFTASCFLHTDGIYSLVLCSMLFSSLQESISFSFTVLL